MFFSFLLLLRPALDGDSSFTLPWWDTLDEPCELKWVGTWRASPPWEAKVALQPPTTHCRRRRRREEEEEERSRWRRRIEQEEEKEVEGVKEVAEEEEVVVEEYK